MTAFDLVLFHIEGGATVLTGWGLAAVVVGFGWLGSHIGGTR